MNKSVKVVFVIFFIFAGFCVSAQSALSQRYLNGAKEKLSQGDYYRAFEYINYVMDNYAQDEIPVDVQKTAEEIYYSYLDSVKSEGNSYAFARIVEKAQKYPVVNSDRVLALIKGITSGELISQDTGASSAIQSTGTESGKGNMVNEGLSKDDLKEIIKILEENNAKNNEKFLEHLNQLDEKNKNLIKEGFSLSSESNSDILRSTKLTFIIVGIVIGVLFLSAMIAFIIIGLHSAKTAKENQKQFTQTLMALANVTESSSVLLGQGSSMRIAASGTGVPAIDLMAQDNSLSPKEREEIKEITAKCVALGREIDTVTGRKNNSKHVAEVIYELSNIFGLSEREILLNFAAALVYDVGFLSVDRNLFYLDRAYTEEERLSLESHTKFQREKLDFIPDKYMEIFENAVQQHHENIDGSGYPGGLKGQEISLIGRMLRIAESYIAMISKRTYREITDKEAAVKELYKYPNLYDISVVELLENII